MTKLIQWLCGCALILGVWGAVLCDADMKQKYPYIAWLWPLALLVGFGLYSVVVIAYRVYNFSDCPQAAEELRKQIDEAKADLIKLGMKF